MEEGVGVSRVGVPAEGRNQPRGKSAPTWAWAGLTSPAQGSEWVFRLKAGISPERGQYLRPMLGHRPNASLREVHLREGFRVPSLRWAGCPETAIFSRKGQGHGP